MRALTPWPALVALAGVAVAVALSASSSRAAPGGVNGAIAFDCSTGICLVNPDGSGLTQIAGTTGGQRARWSPDGSSLTFTMGSDIWTVDPDGSNLADHGAGNSPTYSADGSSIYFDSGGNIYSIPAVGPPGTPTLLPGVATGHSEVADEPNGQGELALLGPGTLTALSLFSPAPANTTQVLANVAADSPAWSPDSSLIYFSNNVAGQWEVDSIAPTDFNGTPTPLVTGEQAKDVAPSPDGTELAYIKVGGSRAVYTAPISGNAVGPETKVPNTDNAFEPAWQPTTTTYNPGLTNSATARVSAGGTITDAVTLSGTGGANTAGTIAVNTYSDSECLTQVHSETVNVTAGDGTYNAVGFVPSSAGAYYWKATYSGDAATDTYSASSPCAGVNGTSVVVPTGGAWAGGGSAISSDFPAPVNNGTSTVVNDGTSGPAQFTYNVPDTPTNCCSNGSWQFETVAPAAGPVTLPWSYSGTDAFFNVNVGLSAFVTHGNVTTFTHLVADGPFICCAPPSTAFGYSGTTTLSVSAGDIYGFVMTGNNGDSNATLQGTLTVNGPVVAPTLTNTVQAAGVPLGTRLSDTVTLAHGSDGTITFNAYDNSSCTGIPADTEGPIGVRGDGPWAAPTGFIPTALGTYYWQVTYSGNTTTATPAATGVCGGPNGSTVVGPGLGATNDTWNSAKQITLNGSGFDSVTTDSLDQSGDARWYKVNVTPGGTLDVDLSNLPANYDLAVFSDIGQAFNELTSPSVGALQTVSAESGNDAFSPSVFSPSVFSPSVFSPSVFSPSVFSPSVFSPSVFSPSVFSPSVFSPSVFSPSVFSPSVFSPSVFSPSSSEDAAAYTGAQTRSLVAISANDGTAPEHVFADVWNNTGSFYIRVNGRNGTYDPGIPFTVSVTEDNGTCTGIAPDTADPDLNSPGVPTGLPANLQTLILTNEDRMTGSAPDFTAMNNSLTSLASQTNGTVVDVDSVSTRVKNLETQADGDTSCPYAKNLVADAIRDIVTDYRTQYPTLKYIVIVGDDNAIPFFRYPDTAGIGPESDYVPPVLDPSASEASLQSNDVLSEDAYGSSSVIHLKGLDLPIPDLAVGRLVKTPTEISGLIQDYLSLPGGSVTPQSSLVTGYDFMAGEASTIGDALTTGTGNPSTRLITPQGTAPSASWTANDLRTDLLGSRHDLIFLGGHFSANNTLAADYSTTMNASELAASGVNLVNSIVFSQGCHSGYSIVNSDAVPGVTQSPDWTEAFATKGATLIAGTGYQYGDTDFLAYSAQLYADFAQSLLYGSGPVAVGNALVQAKQTYLSDTPNLQGIDIKSLLESTLYGLPMLGVNMPDGRTAPPATSSNVLPQLFTTDPGAFLGLSSADLSLSPALTTHTTVLQSPTGGAAPTATYLSGPNGVETSPGAPTLPLATTDVSVPNKVLRGVGFLGGTYTDATGITPLTGAPATELNSPHSPFVSSAFFPSRLWTVNYFGGLTGSSASTLLNLTPVQYETDVPGSLTDDQRTFSNVNLRLFYSGNTQQYGGNTPALAAPPTISRVDAASSGGTVTFQLHVVGDPAAGIQQTWVTYTGVDPNLWESLNLTQDPIDSTLWTGTLTGLSPGQVSALRFVVQAVNGVGLVSLDDNQGNYYAVDQIAPALQTSSALTGTTLTLTTPPSSGDYGSSPSISAKLVDASSAGIVGEQVTFAIGGSSVTATTGAGGVVTAQLPLVDVPGNNYKLSAGFDGDANYASAADSSAFTINKLDTTLALSGGGSPISPNADTGISATLKSGAVGLAQRTVAFVLTPGGSAPAVTQTRITDLNGKASLGVVAGLVAGTYTVQAYFASPGSGVTLPTDPVYNGQVSGTSQLTVLSPTTVTNVTSTLANGAYKVGQVVPVTVTFSNPVTVTGTPQLTLALTPTNRTANYASGSGTATLTFNYTVQAGDTSSDLNYAATTSLALNSGTIKDAGANSANLTLPGLTAAGSLGTNKAIVIDTTAPTVTNVTSTLANGSYNAGTVVPVTVTFSEPVTVTGTPQLTLALTPANRAVNYTSGNGTATLTFNYTVQPGDASADLNYAATSSLALNGGAITDAAANNATLTLPGLTATGSLGTNKAIVIDTTAPTVVNVTSTLANGAYKAGQVVPVSVTFSKPVTVSGTPQLTLALTPTNRAVNYTSGSGTTTLAFNYTVQAGDTSADLNYAATTSLALNGGTIRDAASNSATLTLPGLTATGSLGTNKAIVIDTTAPTVLSINLGAASPTNATSVSWKVTFSEPVTGVKVSSFSLAATGLSGSGGIAVTGSGSVYTVTANTGTGTGTLGLNLSSVAGIIDIAGNTLSSPFTGQVYTVAAKLSTGTTTCNGIYSGTGAQVTVPAGAVCTLVAGTKVTGNVIVQAGGTFVDQGVTIGGNLQATSARAITITGGGTISGNVQVTGLTSAPAGSANSLCNTKVSGNVQVTSGSAASPFDIGNLGVCAGGAAVTINGNLQVTSNAGKLQIGGNTVKGNIQVTSNTGGGSLTSNGATGNCQLSGDHPPIVGKLNTAKGSNSCNASA